jgi:hypothetical protein
LEFLDVLIEIIRKKKDREGEKLANVCCPFQRLFRIFFYFFLGEGIAALQPKWAVRAMSGGCGH